MRIITLENGKQKAIKADVILGSKVVTGERKTSKIFSHKITVGEISSGGIFELKLNDEYDFCDINTNGIKHIIRFYITKTPSAQGTIILNLGGTDNPILLDNISSLNTRAKVAEYLAAKNYVGYNSSYNSGDEYFTLTAVVSGEKQDGVFINNNTGLLGKFLSIQNGESPDTILSVVEKINRLNFPDYISEIQGNSILFTRKGCGEVTNPVVNTNITIELVNQFEIVDNRLILEQSEFLEENTTYEIREEFDLDGKIIRIPQNCTIKIYGGKLINGKVFSDNKTTRLINPPRFQEEFDNRVYFGKFYNENFQEYTYKFDIIQRTIPMSIISSNISYWTFARNTKANYYQVKKDLDRSVKCGFNDIEVWLEFGGNYQTNGVFWDMMPSINEFISIVKRWNYSVKYLRGNIPTSLLNNAVAVESWRQKFKEYVTKLTDEIPTIEYVWTNNEDASTICSVGSIWINAIKENQNWLKQNGFKNAISTNVSDLYDTEILNLNTIFSRNIYLNTTALGYSYDENTKIKKVARSRVEKTLSIYTNYFQQKDIYISETGAGVLTGNGAYIDIGHRNVFSEHDDSYTGLKSYIKVWKYAFEGLKPRLKLVMWWSLSQADEKDLEIMYLEFLNY